MDKKQFIKTIRGALHVLQAIIVLILLLFALVIYTITTERPFWQKVQVTEPVVAQEVVDPNKIEDGIHVATGLKEGEGLQLVIQNCTSCHSPKLISQNRMDIAGWKSTIRWMQETQNLWDLGENEEKILNYLAAQYPPQKKGRRAPLTNIEWYELD